MSLNTYYVIFNTAAGWVGLLGSPAGLKRTTLPQSSRKKVITALGVSATESNQTQIYFKDYVKRLKEYFTGQCVEFPDKLDLHGATNFQRKVWKATQRIPYGETRSYAWIARQVRKPDAARAVGQALGKNPLPVVVPCHRVIASNGNLGGFGGGVEMKKRLLALEKK
jgi:methylated-DNA-[protein]-cysteine S-methyltransferase